MINKKRIAQEQEVLPAEEGSEELEKTDALDDFLFNATNYIYKKRKLFISLGVALAVLLFGAYGINYFLEYQDNQRNEALFKIERIIHDAEKTEKQRYDEGMSALAEFITVHAGARQELVALLYSSNLNFGQKKFAEAEKDLRDVLAKTDSENEIFVLASVYLANVLRDQDKIDDAGRF